MAHLTLAGVSDDGKRLLLVDEDGTFANVDTKAVTVSAPASVWWWMPRSLSPSSAASASSTG